MPRLLEQDCAGRDVSQLINHYHRHGWAHYTPCSYQKLKFHHPKTGNRLALDHAANFAYSSLVAPRIMNKKSQNQYIGEQAKTGFNRTASQDGALHQWSIPVDGFPYYLLARDFEMLDLLSTLMGSAVAPIQTRTYGRGSNIPSHSDIYFADTLPQRGRMIGMIVALEDFKPEAGPTYFIPGTHNVSLWDYAAVGLLNGAPTGSSEGVDFNVTEYIRAARATPKENLNNNAASGYFKVLQDILDGQGWQRRSAELKRGDVLIWAGNLIHGSQPVQDANSTRLSMSAHYMDVRQPVRWNPMASVQGGALSTYIGSGKKEPLSQRIFGRASREYEAYLSSPGSVARQMKRYGINFEPSPQLRVRRNRTDAVNP